MPDYTPKVEFSYDPGTGGDPVVTEPSHEVTNDNGQSQKDPFPDPIISLPDNRLDSFKIWIDQWIQDLEFAQNSKLLQWQQEETDYRAKSLGPQSEPYVGASGDVVPVIAMAVDPIHARLDIGIFKSDPVFRLKPLKKSVDDFSKSLETWVNFYQKNRLDLRRIVAPRLLEFVKHGTMVLKTVYERETFSVRSYDDKWNVVKKEVTRFAGPKTIGIPIQNFLFPPGYQFVQDCPCVFEIQYAQFGELKIAEASKKIKNVDLLEGQETNLKDVLTTEHQTSSNHQDVGYSKRFIKLHEGWCDYDIDGDGIPEHLVVTYHKPTRTILQLRYNYYFHQRKPYTVIPYTVTSDSMYGLGIAEQTKPFQDVITKFQRQAIDNSYLSNIRAFATRKDSGIEGNITLFAGKNIKFDDPSKDIRELKLSDINPSSLSERQNAFGLSEKRTGVSDYLTGRESPIIGSRATATSTLALIQEGTKRVEEVFENLRNGLGDVVKFWIYIWMQYGTDGLDDIVFGDDEVSSDIKTFLDTIRPETFDGAFAIDLSATDAANNKSAQQQMQLAIIQIMMQYLEKVLEGGQMAMQAASTMPTYTAFAGEVFESAHAMFRDLLQKYDVPNVDAYLPDLNKFLHGALDVANAAGGQPGAGVPAGGPDDSQGLAIPSQQNTGTVGPGGIGLPPGGEQISNSLQALGAV